MFRGVRFFHVGQLNVLVANLHISCPIVSQWMTIRSLEEGDEEEEGTRRGMRRMMRAGKSNNSSPVSTMPNQSKYSIYHFHFEIINPPKSNPRTTPPHLYLDHTHTSVPGPHPHICTWTTPPHQYLDLSKSMVGQFVHQTVEQCWGATSIHTKLSLLSEVVALL